MNYPHLVKSNTPHCQTCGTLESLMKQGVGSSGRIYYFCRACNTERCKKWRKKPGNMKKVMKNSQDYQKKNPLRLKSWQEVRHQKIEKRPCQVCGDKKVHAHHPEQDKPLLVTHLCPFHHKAVHLGKITCPPAFNFSQIK